MFHLYGRVIRYVHNYKANGMHDVFLSQPGFFFCSSNLALINTNTNGFFFWI